MGCFCPWRRENQVAVRKTGLQRARQPLKDAVITVDALESLTGYDLFPNLDDSIEESVESTAFWEAWR